MAKSEGREVFEAQRAVYVSYVFYILARYHYSRSNSTSLSHYLLSETSITISNSRRTSFSDSPLYFEVSVEEETLKNVVLHSVATAFARRVFPVPGGPTISTPYEN